MFDIEFRDSSNFPLPEANFQGSCIPRIGETVLVEGKGWEVVNVKYELARQDCALGEHPNSVIVILKEFGSSSEYSLEGAL